MTASTACVCCFHCSSPPVAAMLAMSSHLVKGLDGAGCRSRWGSVVDVWNPLGPKRTAWSVPRYQQVHVSSRFMILLRFSSLSRLFRTFVGVEDRIHAGVWTCFLDDGGFAFFLAVSWAAGRGVRWRPCGVKRHGGKSLHGIELH